MRQQGGVKEIKNKDGLKIRVKHEAGARGLLWRRRSAILFAAFTMGIV
jgi:hypothetical protein